MSLRNEMQGSKLTFLATRKLLPILGTALFGKKNQLQPAEWESVAWLTAS